VIAVCVVSNAFEVIIPDVHDASLVRPAIMASSPQNVGIVSALLNSHVEGQSGCDQQSDNPCQGFQIDHCGHSHVAALAQTPVIPSAVPYRAAQQDFTELDLVSVEIAPHLRPPIA
jgi:hypothetical protein